MRWFTKCRIASHHIRLLSGGRLFYSSPILSAGLVIIVSKDNSSTCCTVRLPGHWHTGTGGQNGKKTRTGPWLWRLSIFVSMATRSTGVLYLVPTGTIPVKSSESHNRTLFGYRGTSSCRLGKGSGSRSGLMRTCVTFCHFCDSDSPANPRRRILIDLIF
jgi:hypothetical protein